MSALIEAAISLAALSAPAAVALHHVRALATIKAAPAPVVAPAAPAPVVAAPAPPPAPPPAPVPRALKGAVQLKGGVELVTKHCCAELSVDGQFVTVRNSHEGTTTLVPIANIGHFTLID